MLAPRLTGKKHRLLSVKVLPYLTPGYKGKNEQGGRKAHFRQCEEYSRGYSPVCIAWPTLESDMPRWIPPKSRIERAMEDANSASDEELQAAATLLDLYHRHGEGGL